MKNVLIIAGAIVLTALIGIFCYTMITGPKSPPRLIIKPSDSIEDKKSAVIDRVKTTSSQPLTQEEINTILKEFSNGNGTQYKLTKDQELQIMNAINKKQ